MRTFDLRAAGVVALASVLFLAHCHNGEDCVRESDCGDGLTCQEGECAPPVTDAVTPIPDASVPDASVPDSGSVDASFDDSGSSDAGDTDASDADADDLDAGAQDDDLDAADAAD